MRKTITAAAGKENIAIICDKNQHTSFGRMTLDLHKVLSWEFDVHIIWLVTPKYFPKESNDTGIYNDVNNISNINNDDSIGNQKNIHKIHAPNLESGWLLFSRPLRRLLKIIKPDKTLLIRPELSFLIRDIHKALPASRVGVMVHDMFAETLYGKSLKFKFINRFFIDPIRGADWFLYNSEYTRGEAHRVMGLAKGHPVIGCPVDRSVFRPPAVKKALLRKTFGLEGYRGVCLNISLDEPRKNVATLFTLAKARPDVAFVRVGPFSPWMREWIAGNRVRNVVHFSRVPQERLVDLYGCADLFVYPSFLEGFGMPPLEALACGTPVVAASSSALRENLVGVVPLIDPPDRVEGYLEVIDAVLSGKDVVNRKAADKLLERFSIESFGERARSSLREISAARSGNSANPEKSDSRRRP